MSRGRYLLEKAFEHQAPVTAIKLILSIWPNAAHVKDEWGQLAIHDLVKCKGFPCLETYKAVVQANPNAVRVRDPQSKNLPIHALLARGFVPFDCRYVDILFLLLEAYPESVYEVDARQQLLPLELACLISCRIRAAASSDKQDMKDLVDKLTGGSLPPLQFACRYGVGQQVFLWIEELFDPYCCSLSDVCHPMQQVSLEGKLPLHEICHHGNQATVAVQFVLDRYPAAVSKKCKAGNLPLHYACRHVEKHRAASLFLLARAYPEALSVTDDDDGLLPAHWLCQNPATTVELVQELITPAAARIPTITTGDYPLHYACRHLQDSEAILRVARCYPGALTEPNTEGWFPALSVCSNPDATLDVVYELLRCWPDVVLRTRN